MSVASPGPVRASTDGWAFCSQGHRHWGRAGAAGLLLHRDGAEGPEVLLQHRASWSHHGGTWGTPGGALHDGEPAGTVRWELHSDPKLGERVELTQTVPAVLPEVVPRALAAWHLHLELFFAAVMGDVRAWSDARVAELTEHYAKQLN